MVVAISGSQSDGKDESGSSDGSDDEGEESSDDAMKKPRKVETAAEIEYKYLASNS